MSFAGPAGKRGGKLMGMVRGRGWSEEGNNPPGSGPGSGPGPDPTPPTRPPGGDPGIRHRASRWEGGEEGERAALERFGWLGAGVALGTLLGAGIALLYAPQSGLQTRAAIRHRGRAMADRGRDAWDELADELRKTAHRRMKRMRRKATQAQWAAEDWREGRGW